MSTGIHIRIQNLKFAFDRNLPYLLDDLSVTFNPGELHFIQGKNGIGKSTFFKILQGKLQHPEIISGMISIDDQLQVLKGVDSVDKNMFRDVKLVVQKFDAMIVDQFTFSENVRLAQIPRYPTLTKFPQQSKLTSFIDQFHIPQDKPVSLLSGGQRQILSILMVLQKPTRLLLLDEPTAALDEQNARLVVEFLHNLVQETGITVLVISHDRDLIDRYSIDGYWNLSEGKMKRETNRY